MSVTSILICLFSMIAFGKSIPPSLCFEPFNFEDCGRRPLHVLYYYKPGSRCEVAIWRGCPTRNMFKDEYECINTCIFMERAKPEDYHNFAMEDDYQMPLDYGEGNETQEVTEGTTIAGDNSTDVEGATGSGGSDNGESGGGGSGGDSTGEPVVAAGDEEAPAEGGEEAAPEAAAEGEEAAEDAPAEDAPAEERRK